MVIIELVNRGCERLGSTTEIDVLFLERSWAGLVGLDDTGCEKLTGSTTGTGSKSDGVSKVEAGQRSRPCSEELA